MGNELNTITQNAVLCFLVASQIGIFAYLIIKPIRMARIFKCPRCSKKVSRGRITLEEMSCEFCDWRLIPVEDVGEPIHHVARQQLDQDGCCVVCSNELKESEYAQLWDNRLYCKSCITEKSEALWDYAIEHESIQEAAPHTLWSIFRRMFLFLDLAMLALFGSIVFLAGWSEGGLFTGLVYLFWCQVVILPLVLMFTGAQTLGFSMQRPEVTVWDNKLTLREGNAKSTTKPLEEFEWFSGNASKTNINKTMMPSGSAILLALPREKGKYEEYVAVGYDENMLEIWKSFLSLAEVPHRADWDREVRDWSGVVAMLAAILVIPVTFASGFAAAFILSKCILMLTGNEELATLLGVQPLMPGTIYGMMYVVVMFPSLGGSLGKTRNSETGRKLSERKMFWTFFSISLFISLMMVISPTMKQSLEIRIIVFLISNTVWFFVSRDLAKRYSNRT